MYRFTCCFKVGGNVIYIIYDEPIVICMIMFASLISRSIIPTLIVLNQWAKLTDCYKT